MGFLDNIIQSTVDSVQSATNKTARKAQMSQPQTLDLIALAENPGEPAAPNPNPFDDIINSVKSAAESAKPMVDNAVSTVKDKAGAAYDQTKPAVDKALEGVRGKTEGLLETAKPAADSAFSGLRQKTAGLIGGTSFGSSQQSTGEYVDPFAAALGLNDDQQNND